MTSVLEFGTLDCRKAVRILERALGCITSIAIVRLKNQESLLYEDVDWMAGELIESLEKGDLYCASVTGAARGSLALLFPPPRGSKRTYWFVSADWARSDEEADVFVERLMREDDVIFFLRGRLDSVILETEPLPCTFDSQNFPWEDRGLIDGAVRLEDDSWDYRRGRFE